MPNGPTRFIYSAKAVGVGANFGGPNALRQFWASRALPITGGSDPPRREAGPSNHPVLNFAWAETELSGIETSSGVHDTMVKVTVANLNVLGGVITADLVSATLGWRCQINMAGAPRSVRLLEGVGGTRKPFVNLRIGGAAVDPDLDVPLATTAAANFPQFRVDLPSARPGRHHTRAPRAGAPGAPFHTGFTHLVELPNPQIDGIPGLPPHEFGVYNGPLPPGIDRIYLCDWFAEPDRQCLTAMRVKLAPPNQGEIVICDPDDNGRDYP